MKNVFSLFRLYLLLLLLGFSCSQKKNQESTTAIANPEVEDQRERKTVLFFGNSLTAGYGIEEDEAFPALIQTRLDSLDLDYRVINGGLSGETTASGLSRLDWFLEEKPEIFVLELGGNDGLRGIPLEETEKNLREIIRSVKNKYPETKILLAGMQIPPNMGQSYTDQFQGMYAKIAEEEGVTLIPFLLEGVAGDPDLNLPDGIHPTAEGHQLVAATVWEYLEPLI
ncbi:acyl-CoA thioesterase-1 [Cyclobacterium lianum]|uniref:Acyl-CoA thioesterase-1 n=1 Tax=Cyclobacterium lianum TaxID=388280 RepID=A0A1M7PIV9_9BACT|nr:arylesterase [Cyclobacterium lianum]SHN17012.1 acyl-CoA thioesterase-1 [Cyclobacterium lianum]